MISRKKYPRASERTDRIKEFVKSLIGNCVRLKNIARDQNRIDHLLGRNLSDVLHCLRALTSYISARITLNLAKLPA
jgi:hypothetical protein